MLVLIYQPTTRQYFSKNAILISDVPRTEIDRRKQYYLLEFVSRYFVLFTEGTPLLGTV
jgi:hypothetical protein